MVITSRSGTVPLNPAWYQAGAGFVLLGIAHILSGVDHLLFLLCLVIPFLRLRQVVGIVSAFTVAHSFTLLGSAYGLAPSGNWFPPFVETAIAASVVYMALENIVGADLGKRWLVTGLFGLVHGFGFSYGLKENLQFAGTHLLVSLFSFNVGIEIGQIAVLGVMLPLLALVRRYVLPGRIGVIVLSALVAHTGWHWMIERGEVLWNVEWPTIDAAAVTTLARWTAGILLAVGTVRFFRKRAAEVWTRRAARRRPA
jgi:hydrogenase/urease accessory protein HupE